MVTQELYVASSQFLSTGQMHMFKPVDTGRSGAKDPGASVSISRYRLSTLR